MKGRLEKRFEWLGLQATTALYQQGEHTAQHAPAIVAQPAKAVAKPDSPLVAILKFSGTLVAAIGLSVLIRIALGGQIIPAFSFEDGWQVPDEKGIQVTIQPGYWAKWGLVIHFTGVCTAGIILMRKTVLATIKQLPDMLKIKKLKALAALK